MRRASGERVEALVQLGPPRPTIRLRAIDETGAPIGGEVLASLVLKRGELGWRSSTTHAVGPGGSIVIPIVADADTIPSRLVLSAGIGRAKLEATVELPSLPAGSSHDLGTVVLSAP